MLCSSHAVRGALHVAGGAWVATASACARAARCRWRVAQRAARARRCKSTDTVARGFFHGRLDAATLFRPFPCALEGDELDQLRQLVEPVSKFFEHEVDSESIDLQHAIAPPLLEELAAMGLFGLQVPEQYGGLGLSNTAYARVLEEVRDASVAVTLMAHQSIGMKGILMFGSDEQKAKYLPELAAGSKVAAFVLTEPGSGSDAASIVSRAELSDCGTFYTLNGDKIWISNGGFADVFTVFARTRVTEGGEEKDKITAFIVERQFGGVTSGRPETKLGIRGANTTTVTFSDCRVPAENVLLGPGKGFKIAMEILNNGRFGMGAATSSGIKQMIALASSHATERKQFGQALGEFGLVRRKFADMAVHAYVLEAMVYMTTAQIDGREADLSMEAAMCKVFGSESMWAAADASLQIHGGAGFMAGDGALPFERALRDARILPIFEGTNEILRLFIALTGLQGRGATLKAVAKNAKTQPVATARFLGTELVRRSCDALGVRDPLRPACPAVPAELSAPMRKLDALVAKFGLAVDMALATYGTDVLHQQMQLQRISDCAMHLFALTAGLSRAAHAVDAKVERAAHDVAIVQAFAQQTETRVSDWITRIRTEARAHKAGDRNSEDALLESIADDVLAAGKFVSQHSLTLPRPARHEP